MAMSGGAGSRLADINVTPMIDILLVLLIIFMVIVPATPKGLDAHLPQPQKTGTLPKPERAIVVEAFYRPDAAPSYRINDREVTHSELLPRLTEIYANRAERVMYVKGDENVSFALIADIIDIGRAANVDHIGLITPKIQTSM